MRDRLAQRVLAKVMGWEQERLLREQDVLQTLASYKYDAYDNFEPGVKFVESLAQWLYQFTPEDRETAYQFARDRLVFVSAAELTHLVRSMYPDVIRPVIRRAAADVLGCSPYSVRRIEESPAFAEMRRRSLFLGLSDGARIDSFRRSSPDLDNEQVYAVYDLGEAKLEEMHKELAEALHTLGVPGGEEQRTTFSFLFLIDDFAGTGTTMLRRKEDGAWTGRLHRLSQQLRKVSEGGAFDPKNLLVYVCFYMVTQEALDHFEKELRAFENEDAAWSRCEVLYVQHFRETVSIRKGQDAVLDAFLNRYYSEELEDKKSYRVGKKGIKYGYGGCGLPLVVHHNTPNNSLYILWKDGNTRWPFTPLFRRFERHRKLIDDDESDVLDTATAIASAGEDDATGD